MILFCDCHDVLIDLVGALCRAHQCDPYADPNNLGKWEIHEAAGMLFEDFWRPARSRKFWSSLDWTPHGLRVWLTLLETDCPIYLATSDMSPECAWGTKTWIQRELPAYYWRTFVGAEKQLLAGPGRVLIDDRDQNVELFREAGGSAILFPRSWNKLYSRAFDAKNYLQHRLDRILRPCRGLTPTGLVSDERNRR